VVKSPNSVQLPYGSREFYLEDLPRTLFPLTTNKVLVENGHAALLAFAQALIAGGGSFLPQRRVYASKDELHLRRTVKLDAVAETILYDLIYRNRALFRKPHLANREHYGYRFEVGRPLSPSRSYAEWKKTIASNQLQRKEYISFDLASYFNGVYHHDLQAWFDALGASAEDVTAFGKFFREINAGRSLDCLPQGLYPSKMIGNDFLRFIEESASVRADYVARFMDDTLIFGNDLDALKSDFAEIQRLVGLKGLSVNAAKTEDSTHPDVGRAEEPLDEIKKRLLNRRRTIIVLHYDEMSLDEEDDNADDVEPLDKDEVAYIEQLLKGRLTEEDAEMILVVMRDHVELVEAHLAHFAKGYPHLAKSFYSLCGEASDKEEVAKIVLDVATDGSHVPEYQLFWFGMMLEGYLIRTKRAPDLINALYNHASATDITKAKILEIADNRFGLPEMRETYLREGRSDWLAWASAVGSRTLQKSSRNYLLDYFKNGSTMNRLIADIVQNT
jgi:Reverse transcriptase (RNA-dependent DNA polymerase)